MSEKFFGFDEDDEYGRGVGERSSWRWIGVVIMVVSVVLCAVMCFFGMRSLQAAREDEPYAGHSWVMQGTYVKTTNDLKAKTYNGVYEGNLPQDSNMKYQKFDSGMADPKSVEPGAQVTFRGTQTGAQDSDFPQEADALLAVDGNTLKVVRTDEAGSLHAVTDDSVAAQKRTGGLLIGGGILVLALGVAGTIWSVRRTRAEEGRA